MEAQDSVAQDSEAALQCMQMWHWCTLQVIVSCEADKSMVAHHISALQAPLPVPMTSGLTSYKLRAA